MAEDADDTDAPEMILERFSAESLFPQLDDEFAPIELEFEQKDWAAFKQALERPLSEEFRLAIKEVSRMFVRWVCATACGVPAPRQYLIDLLERIDGASEAVDSLLPWLIPFGPPSTSATVLDESQTKAMFRSVAALKGVIEASETSDENSPYMGAADYLRRRMFATNPEILAELVRLPSELQKIRSDVNAHLPENHAGQHGFYEVNALLEHLLEIAQYAGDDLALPSGDIEEDGPTPAYSFVCEVLMSIQDHAPAAIRQSGLSTEQQQEALKRIQVSAGGDRQDSRKLTIEARTRIRGYDPSNQ